MSSDRHYDLGIQMHIVSRILPRVGKDQFHLSHDVAMSYMSSSSLAPDLLPRQHASTQERFNIAVVVSNYNACLMQNLALAGLEYTSEWCVSPIFESSHS